ncbi:hypothetical protein Amsp01_039370 [Amycolatopsis sp. NBRC 101858]|nr:hypothetical protein Amsp01_039370 [Amycolatopsis sp. NBRC 101858]
MGAYPFPQQPRGNPGAGRPAATAAQVGACPFPQRPRPRFAGNGRNRWCDGEVPPPGRVQTAGWRNPSVSARHPAGRC